MTIVSIIGTGGMATSIASRIAKAGHTLELINRNPAKAQALADKLAAGAKTGAYGAAPAGDIVILAVPYGGASAVVADFGDTLDGKIVIDITNPVAPDLSGLLTPGGSSGAQEIAKGLPPGAKVVKAFNTIFGHVLVKGDSLDAFLAGDDVEAKKAVSALLESLGLRPLDVGGLRMASTLEALGLLMIGLARNGAGSWDFALKVDVG